MRRKVVKIWLREDGSVDRLCCAQGLSEVNCKTIIKWLEMTAADLREKAR